MLDLAWRAVLREPGALDAIVDEIALDAQSLVGAGAITLQQGEDIKPLIKDALAQGVGTWVDAYAKGDLESLQFQAGKLIGENPDLVAEGALKLATLTRRAGMQTLLRGFARAEQTGTVGRALEKAALARDADLASAVAKGLEGPSLAKQIPTGAVLGDDVLRALGQGAGDIGRLQDIAQGEEPAAALPLPLRRGGEAAQRT